MKYHNMISAFNFSRLRYMAMLLLLLPVTISAQDMKFAWAKKMGGATSDWGQAVDTDSAGNLYVTGYYNGPADLGNGSLTYTGGSIFVSKFDNSGNLIWSKTSSEGKNSDRPEDIAIGNDGSIYVTGWYHGRRDFDPGPDSFFVEGSGIFVFKWDSAGNFVWAHGLGAGRGYGIAVDADDNVYVSGRYQGTATFGSITLPGTAGNNDGFITKINASGNFVWAKAVSGTHTWGDDVAGLDVDAAGNIYAVGTFGNTVTLGSLSLQSNGGTDAFITKMNPAGDFLWAKKFGGSSGEMGYGIAADPDGNVYASGYFVGRVDFDPGPDSFFISSMEGRSDAFVLKLNTNGDFVWANRVGGPRSELGGFDIAIDKYTNVYLASRILDTVVTINTTMDTVAGLGTAGDDYDIHIAKLDREGNFVWQANMGSPEPDVSGAEAAFGITAGPGGSVYVTGKFHKDNADFDPGPDTFYLHSYFGESDGFILKLDCVPTYDTIRIALKCSDTAVNGETYSMSGTYMQYHPGYYGCDSQLTIHLVIDTVLEEKPLIDVAGVELSSSQLYAGYQWILNDTAIPGATGRIHTAVRNGRYQVYATDARGCSDTSAVYLVNNVSVRDVKNIPVYMHPNPAKDYVYVHSPVLLDAELFGMDGRMLRTEHAVQQVSLAALPAGIYILRLKDREGRLVLTEKIIKE